MSSLDDTYTVVIQPTSFCNIACSYCYLPQRDDRSRLSIGTLEKIITQVFSSKVLPRRFNLTWHAGEPLSLPLSYYQEAFAIIKDISGRYDKIYRHTFQTNAIGLAEDWCDFIREHDISVGVSIDGPKFIHDQYRKTRAGGGTHDRTMQGIRHLQRAEIPFSVIAVITKQSLDYADEIFDFFLKHDMRNIAFNPEESEGANDLSSLTDDFYAKFKAFLVRFIERLDSCEGEFHVRELKYGFMIVMNKDREKLFANYRKAIARPDFMPILTFDVHGNYYPFAPEFAGNKSTKYNDFIVGNVHTGSLDDIHAGATMKKLATDFKSGIDRCSDVCEYFQFCGGDFSSNKYFEHGTLDAAETTHCKFRRQALVEAIRSYLRTLVAPDRQIGIDERKNHLGA